MVRELTRKQLYIQAGRLFESGLESAEFLLKSLQALHVGHREFHRLRKHWKGGGKRQGECGCDGADHRFSFAV